MIRAAINSPPTLRSNLVEQLASHPAFPATSQPDRPRRGSYRRTEDETILADIRAITDARPTYGYRRVTALLNRARLSSGKPPLNHKRVFRLMRLSSLLLQPYTGRRAIRAHEGTVVAPASNQRWASAGTSAGGISGEMIRDLIPRLSERDSREGFPDAGGI